MKLRIRLKGGPGSGHHGHSGRPGKHGGSLPGSGNSKIVSGLLDKHDGIFSDNSDDAYKAANALTQDLKEQSKELGLYAEVTHWTGAIDPDEYNDFSNVKNYMPKPSHVPASVDNNVFTNSQLTRYYGQNGKKGSPHIVDFYKRALAGDFGDKHKAAATLIQDISQEVFRRKYGDSATLYRGGSAVGMSVSESRSMAARAGRLLSKNSTVYELTVPVDAILFGERIIPSPYPEKEWVIDTSLLNKEYKGGPGSGHHGHAGLPGHHGGSAPGTGSTSNKLPPEQRVWQGKQQKGKVPFNQNEVGRRGEVITTKAMQDMFGAEFSLMNEGLNNAPIDVAGDHRAIEVKTGVATNGRSAQQWRITTSYTAGPTERDLIAAMTKSERSEYNRYKQTQSMLRKRQAVKEMSDIAGAAIKPATVGVILSPDGTKGDVFYVPGFHLRLGWNHYANDEYYIGTYDVE